MQSTDFGSFGREELGSADTSAAPAQAAAAAAPSEHPAHVARPAESRFARAAWIALGSVSVAFGVIGVILPGWPTTIFIIIAAACYARSSQRLYDRVTRNRLFGRHARDFRETGAMPVRAKAFALGVMWPFVGLSVLVAIPETVVVAKVATVVLAIIGTAYILHLPSRPRALPAAGDEG